MVKQIKQKDTYYQCGECKFYYKTKNLARKCEDFCKKHHSCSIEITKHAIKIR